MSAERRPIDIVRAALAASDAGDSVGAMSMFSEGVVVHEAASLPFGGDHDGLPAYLALLRDLNTRFSLEILDQQVIDAGDRVLLKYLITFRATGTNRAATLPSIEVLTFTGDRVTDVDVFYKDTAALVSLTR